VYIHIYILYIPFNTHDIDSCRTNTAIAVFSARRRVRYYFFIRLFKTRRSRYTAYYYLLNNKRISIYRWPDGHRLLWTTTFQQCLNVCRNEDLCLYIILCVLENSVRCIIKLPTLLCSTLYIFLNSVFET